MVPTIETQAVDRSVLAGALDSVRNDSDAQKAAVAGNVEAALSDSNSCMMGGWTS
ncbi:hypothetical protein ACFRMO_08005 [Streptomyces anulatus]|uniref:hypothetical protein n=1 Tax=Streptomyces anulatus TaxID=1892 RepID=UPI0036B354A1